MLPTTIADDERGALTPLRYGIVANPVSGGTGPDRKRALLREAARILDAEIVGLDTASSGELGEAARQHARRCDVLVAAGGDGTFSDVVNALPLEEVTLAYLPLGTGNALRHALACRGTIPENAAAIRSGRNRRYDLIRCDGPRLGFMASLGLDGAAVRLWERERRMGGRGRAVYARAMLKAVLHAYRPAACRVEADGQALEIPRLLSLMVVKQPYYGFGFRAVPRARWDDGFLHVRALPAGRAGSWSGIAAALADRDGVRGYRTARKVDVHATGRLSLQVDGELGRQGRRFSFSVLPGVLRIRH